MVEFKSDAFGNGMNSKKRRLPTELTHRFKSKEDFLD